LAFLLVMNSPMSKLKSIDAFIFNFSVVLKILSPKSEKTLRN